ncbi:MAG: hypothetical protein IIC93_02880 [Chloroflexi bacterium]|nr:hypothetical protein [Chloroflexota bacterium]
MQNRPAPIDPKILSVAMGTTMFALFGAGHGAAWSGVVLGNSYIKGAIVGAVIFGVFAFFVGTVWAKRFAPVGLLQMASEFQRTGKFNPTPMTNLQALAYRGLSAVMVPIVMITLVATIVAVLLRDL